MRDVLELACRLAVEFREGLADRPVGATATVAELRASLGGPLAEEGVPAAQVIEELSRAADRGLVASAGPRYFGFVIGGSSPASVAADWLTSAWDQNSGLYATGPAQSVVEEVSAGWLRELFGLPRAASVGFVTGCQMAHFTALAAARSEVLRRAGWDVEQDGLQRAPSITIVTSEEAHVTVFRALRLLGLGERTAVRVAADGHGRMRMDALAAALERATGPTIVCAQAGNVNTGACDDLQAAAELSHARGAWLHVDGAFGLWAAASAGRRDLVRGAERADSWATDAHKWLNVPYDCGIVLCAHIDAHRRSMTAKAPYLVQQEGAGAPRDPVDWVPEFSRRARGFTVYAALRALGRRGVAALVDRCCDQASRFAALLRRDPAVQILNEVVLNQVLVRFGDDDALTRAVIARAQAGGEFWLAGTVWHGLAAARISVSGEATTEVDIDRSAAALLRALHEEQQGFPGR